LYQIVILSGVQQCFFLIQIKLYLYVKLDLFFSRSLYQFDYVCSHSELISGLRTNRIILYIALYIKEILCGYRIADKLPKGEFKRLTACVIDLDKGVPFSSINALSLSLLNLAEQEET